MTREAEGRRLNRADPDNSLLLLKATGQIPHEGGVRFAKDSWPITAHCSVVGATLVILNEDRPGVIGAVGTVLGRAGINIARLQVGLNPGSKRAASLWGLDSALPPRRS